MELINIEIDGEEKEVALKLDKDFYEQNYNDLDDTMEIDIQEVINENEDWRDGRWVIRNCKNI